VSVGVKCPECRGYLELAPSCEVCSGRGELLAIPMADRNWDHIVAGLYLGAHDTQPGGGETRVTDEFDVVVSLYQRDGYGPSPHIPHHTHTMADARLSEDNHAPINRLADIVVEAMDAGQSVLVRCHAGLNRSALVAGLALVKQGWTAQEAADRMRAARSAFVLSNAYFEAYLTFSERTASNGWTRCTECGGAREHFGVPCAACDGLGRILPPDRSLSS
jgi:hypothetical protein